MQTFETEVVTEVVVKKTYFMPKISHIILKELDVEEMCDVLSTKDIDCEGINCEDCLLHADNNKTFVDFINSMIAQPTQLLLE